MKRFRGTLVAAVLVAGLGACESATAPSEMATMEVAAHGDASGQAGTAGASQPAGTSGATGTAEGTVEFRARVWVQSDTRGWVELTQGSAQQVSVDASGRQGAKVFLTGFAHAGTYNRVRIEFEQVQANVSGGIYLGTNLLTGTIRVDAGSTGKVVVERSIDVQAGAGTRSRLVIDLNSSQWLSQASAQTRTTSRAAFESAVRVFVG
jgi:hypothetical protein